MFSIWKDVVFLNYANFKGRDSRGDYWRFYFANILVLTGLGFALAIVSGFMGIAITAIDINEEVSIPIILLIVLIALLITLASIVPLIAATTRRLHDANLSGWFQLLYLIPYLGGITVLILCMLSGTEGDNKFGPPED